MLRKVGLCQCFVGKIEFLIGKKYEKLAQIECGEPRLCEKRLGEKLEGRTETSVPRKLVSP